MQYIAMKFDMVKSRKLPERSNVQDQFLLTAQEINKKFGDALKSKFIVTHGDEAQALLKSTSARAAFCIFEHLVVSMEDVDFRCGIGLGTLNTPLQETAIGMDGEAWQNAKQAIDSARGKRQVICFRGFKLQLQSHLDAVGNLLCFLQSRWTREQLETIRLLSQSYTQTEIATLLGVSDAAISKRLTAAGWQHYFQGREALAYLIQQAV